VALPSGLRLSMLALAALLYVAVTTLFVELEHPGLGIGHLFYVPIVLVALANARSLAVTTEGQLRLAGEHVTFGWATYPQDGENALALDRAADERLYARKMAHGLRRETVPVPA
jgi:hypothetical protein